MSKLDELKKEADALGIKYNGNIGTAKLQEKLDTFKASQAADDSVEDLEPVEDPVTDEVDDEVNPDIVKEAPVKNDSPAQKRASGMAEIARKMKADALKTRIVTITNNDKRDSHVTTTAYLSMENQYFGLSKIVPLDIPIELEQCLIDVAKSVEIVLHVDEIVDGKRTGNRRPQYVKKYVVSYEDM